MDALRRAFNDISLGYSKTTLFGRAVYIKHLSYGDQIENDAKKDEFYKHAKDQGLFTIEDKLKILREDGSWTEKDEKELIAHERQIKELVEGKKKNMKMPSLVKSYNDMIKKEEEAYQEKQIKKRRLLGLTCESYSERELNDYYIYSNIFSDKQMTVLFFTSTEFDYLNESQIDEVTSAYNKVMEMCSENNIKKLAIQPFFQNYFSLTGDNFSQFFGKPICSMTFFQVRLISLGAHFRSIFSNHDIAKFPKNVMDDPDLLIDYAAAAKRGKEDMEMQGAYDQDAIVVGARKEDADVLGVKTQKGLASEIVASGGNMLEWMKNKK